MTSTPTAVDINKRMYFQTDYKYLPIGSNINVHLISIGFGLTL